MSGKLERFVRDLAAKAARLEVPEQAKDRGPEGENAVVIIYDPATRQPIPKRRHAVVSEPQAPEAKQVIYFLPDNGRDREEELNEPA
jgi:hypothetical protein